MTTDRLTTATALLPWAGLGALIAYAAAADFVPQCWPTLGAGVWLLFLLGKGLNNLSEPNIVQVCRSRTTQTKPSGSACAFQYKNSISDVLNGYLDQSHSRCPVAAGVHVLHISILIRDAGTSSRANLQRLD